MLGKVIMTSASSSFFIFQKNLVVLFQTSVPIGFFEVLCYCQQLK